MAQSGSKPAVRAASSLPSAMLLALTGGGLDAFVYLNHGQVFAAAMTGNAVLLGIAAIQHRPHLLLLRLTPIVAFFAGAWLAELLDNKLRHHSVTVGLAGEIVTLLAASFLPGGFPDEVFVSVVALAAAYQVATFRKADSYSYNSTFMTGNLRTAVDGLYDALTPATRREGLRKFRELSLIILSFIGGAAIGGLLSPRLFNHTLWVVVLPLTGVLTLAVRRNRRLRTKVGSGQIAPDPR